MKTRIKESQINQDFSQKDQNYLRKFDNASSDPEIQMLTEEKLEDENEIEYFCSICKSKLDHLRQGIENTIWRCNECMEYFDTGIQDIPLIDISSTGDRVHS